MALSLDIVNVLQFYTFLSPIFISVFLLFQSAMKGDLKGIVWIIGSFVAWGVGMIFKSMFNKQDDAREGSGKRRLFDRPDMAGSDSMRVMAGSTKSNVPDYCKVFRGPFSSDIIELTSIPSLNALFHAFTVSYIAMGVGSNSVPPPEGIIFLIVIGILAIINCIFRVVHSCDTYLDVFVGAVLGTGLGVAWFFAINTVNPTWTYYGEEDVKGKCVLGKQKFRCTYD
uniref:Phosphatidic acid phosphatase type 2/haloperoxidase domain-containing protein n=1 Tax=viral metagenome TaxID=1070528 RepID=A0A6C0JAF4_9ZZZZ|tara:strand:+ start:1143 stop:1820 length:678 start_codon:yes stop_codon:yes gene_type:complete